MDESRGTPYVHRAMNLLLLLSALLSALTGAVPGVRRADVPQAMAQGLVAPRTGHVAVAKVAMRPVAPVPVLMAVVDAPLLRLQVPVVMPIWADRRRE